MVAAARPAAVPLPPPPVAAATGGALSHIGFSDVLSAVNPLQYLPVVGTIYREVTGDRAPPALRVAVGVAASFLLGGPVGLAATMIGVVVDEVAHSGSLGGDASSRAAYAAHAYSHAARTA